MLEDCEHKFTQALERAREKEGKGEWIEWQRRGFAIQPSLTPVLKQSLKSLSQGIEEMCLVLIDLYLSYLTHSHSPEPGGIPEAETQFFSKWQGSQGLMSLMFWRSSTMRCPCNLQVLIFHSLSCRIFMDFCCDVLLRSLRLGKKRSVGQAIIPQQGIT